MRWRRNEIVGRARKVVGMWVLRPQRINDDADNEGPDDGDGNPETKQSVNKAHALSPAKRVASSPKDRIQVRAIRVAFFEQGCGRSGEQRRTGLGQLHISAALMQPKPAAIDREIEASAVFGRAAAMFEQERPVDLLDVDAAILNWLDGSGDLQQLARSGVGVSESDFGSTNFMGSREMGNVDQALLERKICVPNGSFSSPDGFRICPLIRVCQKRPADSQGDAIDPIRKSGMPVPAI